MKIQTWSAVVVAAFLACALFSSRTDAAPIDLGALGINWSMEQNPQQQAVPTGWSFTELAGVSDDNGIHNHSGQSDWFTDPPFQGVTSFYANLNSVGVSSAEIASLTASTLAADQVYTLNVALGTRPHTWADIQYHIGLRTTGGTELGTFSSVLLEREDSLADRSVDLSYMLNVNAEAAAYIGQDVEIVVRGTNVDDPSDNFTFTQMAVDNVRLDLGLDAVAGVPEPSSLAMWGVMLGIGFGDRRWRRTRLARTRA
jgi:hypothetical protein